MGFLSRLFGKSESSSEMLCPHCERSMESGHNVEACARKRMSRRHFFQTLGGAAATVAIAKVLPAPRTLDLDEFAAAYINPAAKALANAIDSQAFRFVRQYDPLTGLFASRLDVLYGFSRLQPELCCQVIGGDDDYLGDDDYPDLIHLPAPTAA